MKLFKMAFHKATQTLFLQEQNLHPNAFFMQANTGYHDFEVVFHNANGDIQAANTTLYLDHTSQSSTIFPLLVLQKIQVMTM